jgi:queuine tRNA-ribosyltransferase
VKLLGTLHLKNNECAKDEESVVQPGCGYQACAGGISCARLHSLFKTGNPLAAQLLTQHNIAYMMSLVRNMRTAILEDRFAEFAKAFIHAQYRGKSNGGEDVPTWVKEALAAASIEV